MKKFLCLLGGLFFLLVCDLPAPAQVSDELQAFQDAAGSRATLFRGLQAAQYPFLANGHPYWESPEFKAGDIVFENNLYRGVMINIDAHKQQALVRISLNRFSTALEPGDVSSITCEGRQFVGIGPGHAVLPAGFYELMGDGPVQIYKHVDKRLNSSVNNVNGDGIGYYDENYREDVTRFFQIQNSYFFRDREGRFTRIRGKGALLKMFPEQKREIRRSLKTIKAELPRKDFDAYCRAVLKFATR